MVMQRDTPAYDLPPITMYLSRAYYFAGRYADAAEVLARHSRIKSRLVHFQKVAAALQQL